MESSDVDMKIVASYAMDKYVIGIMAALLPEPAKEEIEYHIRQDRLKNPHNEPHLTKRRSESEIVAMLRCNKALELFMKLESTIALGGNR